jgi:hypothetical protein
VLLVTGDEMIATGLQAVSRGLKSRESKVPTGVRVPSPKATKLDRLREFFLGSKEEDFVRWRRAMTADALYCCGRCGASLNVSSNDLYPPDTHFEAGNRGTLSFMEVDMSKFRKQKEKKWRSCFPFFDSLDYWGIHRRRTQLRCVSCNTLLGYIYYDMPRRQGRYSSWGPSQSVPKGERYRLKIKALQEAPVFHQKWQ